MRIYEIIQPNRVPVATERFHKDLKQLLKADSNVLDNLAEFIEFRKTAGPDQHFGKKDYMLSNGDFAGFWHWHIIFGKYIIFYRMISNQLQLIAITSHKMLDGPPPKSFAKWMKGLTPADFTPFEVSKDQEINLTDNDKDDIIKLLWELASNPSDRIYLEDAVKGTWAADLKDYILHMVNLPLTDDEMGNCSECLWRNQCVNRPN